MAAQTVPQRVWLCGIGGLHVSAVGGVHQGRRVKHLAKPVGKDAFAHHD